MTFTASRMRPLILALTGLAVAVGGQDSPRAAAGDVLPFKATERTLANGLKLIVVPTGFPNLVSIQIPVQTGSRNEIEPGKSGFAHFFEHLMFRGTPATPPERYREIMSKAGARDNANTGDDYTRYYSTFAKEHLERILALYADMFQHLSYSEADFKTEARAILGEYNKNSADPVRKLLEAQRERYYQAHTYKHTTMGFIADIENMPNEYEYSKVFFQRWYRPQFTTLVVAGDVEPEQVIALAGKYWGSWKAGPDKPLAILTEPAPTRPAYVHVPWAADTLPYVTVAFPSPAFDETSKDSAAMDVIAALYFGSTSDLYNRLVVSEQKVDSLFVDVPGNVDASLFTVFARLKNPADAVYVRDQILATVASARSTAVSRQRLDDAKSFSRYSFARTLDSTERIASVVSAYASYKRSFDTVNNYYRALDSLQLQDLRAASQRYFTDAGLIVTTLSQAALPEGIRAAPSLTAIQPAAPPGAPPAPALAAATPPAVTSSSGPADVPVVQQKSVLPQLDFKLLFTVGSAHDPAGKEGLAALTASMIFEVWIRPVVPANAHMTLRLAIHELGKLVEQGMTAAQFQVTRDYLMNNVYVMTARQDQQLGYALDSRWYGIEEFTSHVRKALTGLAVEQVNAAIRKHLTPRDLSVVIVTKDAAGLKQALVTDAFSAIKYDGEKPADLLAEDKVIGAMKLGIAAESVRITPIAEVFAR